MKIAYAFRENRLYPYQGREVPGNELPPAPYRDAFLKRIGRIGVEGIELGPSSFGGASVTEAAAREQAKHLADMGLPVVCIRGGGGFASARGAARSRAHIRHNIKLAAWTGANLVNTTVCCGGLDPRQPGSRTGEPASQGGSHTASAEEYERTARELQVLADEAADQGVTISIEVHQNSIVDNSWSALHLHRLVDRPNLGINPDLGNIYWTYDIPDETSEEAIANLAPVSTYWHCKNLYRVYQPQAQRSVFVHAPLPDGEIDYRFAISAMRAANYDGYLAIESARSGDVILKDTRSVEYVRSILSELEAGGES